MTVNGIVFVSEDPLRPECSECDGLAAFALATDYGGSITLYSSVCGRCARRLMNRAKRGSACNKRRQRPVLQ